jgi:hypothetical protein
MVNRQESMKVVSLFASLCGMDTGERLPARSKMKKRQTGMDARSPMRM